MLDDPDRCAGMEEDTLRPASESLLISPEVARFLGFGRAGAYRGTGRTICRDAADTLPGVMTLDSPPSITPGSGLA